MAAQDLNGNIFFSRVTKGGWDEEIERLVADYNEGPPIISGGLTVTGHSYWVILEYGSSPATSGLPGPKPGDIVELRVPFNAPQVSKGHRRYYPIRPRKRQMLVWREGSRIIRRRIVFHPGNISRGFIRRIIQKVQGSLFDTLLGNAGREWHDEAIPDRDELVQLLNQHLHFILDAVRKATPVGRPGKYITTSDDAGHLKNAWGVDLAR